ncbi:hypothetical protein ACIBW9_15540 [Streptomyces sp. NPDC049541]|uniref:hypothetical protein n=1 Tax=Streptomyces sp. NPDC049541 TaxID=3365594 RepID=UPI0037963992
MGYGLPSKQTVNVVGGRLQARNVQVGCRLCADDDGSATAGLRPGGGRTLDGEHTVQTTVAEVATVKVREVVDVVTDHVTFTVAPDQMLGTPDG